VKIAVIADSGIAFDARVQRVVKSFAARNFQVDLFAPNYKISEKPIFDSPNIQVISYSLKNNWQNNNLLFWKKYENCIGAVLSTKINYDFIYINDYPLLKSGVQLKAELKTKLIYDTHEIYVETINQFFPTSGIKAVYGKALIAFNKWLHKSRESRLIKQVDYMVTVCDSFRQFFKKRYGVDALVLKNCPLDLPQLNESNLLRENLKLKETDKILLYQGAFNYSRGLEKLVQSANFFDENIQLVLMGDGPLQSRLKEMAKDKSNVHFHPKVPFAELIQYSASADIGILLIEAKNRSKELTLPNKVFEYMAAGIPFITNKLPEASSIVEQHNCGYIIDDSNPECIASAVNKIFTEDSTHKGHLGRKAIESHYLWDMDFEKLMNFIQTK
jgi:glycosyltransferase involved in cell wall biosynthesis